MDTLSDRIKDTLKRAGLNPRVLGGVTKIHYTTIYSIIKAGDAEPTPVVKETLERTLKDINTLVDLGRLPLSDSLTTEHKIPAVSQLIQAL